MKPCPDVEAPSRRLFHRLLRETDESATISLFMDLCRASPPFRTWLWEEFGRDPNCRQAFERALRSTNSPPTRFAELDGDSAAWQAETRGLRRQFSERTYGGLTFDQLTERIVRLQAGKGDAAAFLFALEWRRQQSAGAPSPRLLRGGHEILAAAMQPGGAELLRQLARAAELTEEIRDRSHFRAVLGFSDWWKLTLLFYLMRHPAASYRTRDLQRHLAAQGCAVSGRALRQFCIEEGIARDMRAGRPPPAIAQPQRRRGQRRVGAHGRR